MPLRFARLIPLLGLLLGCSGAPAPPGTGEPGESQTASLQPPVSGPQSPAAAGTKTDPTRPVGAKTGPRPPFSGPATADALTPVVGPSGDASRPPGEVPGGAEAPSTRPPEAGSPGANRAERSSPAAAGMTIEAFLREQERLLVERPDDAALQRLVTLLHLAREDWPAAAQAAGRLAPRDDTWRLVAAALESRVGQNAEAAALMDEVRRRWRAAAPLAVRRAALCQRISGFSEFQPYPAGRTYAADDPADGLLIYIEIDNAVLDMLPDGRTRLSLHYDFELIDPSGQAVPTPAWEAYHRDDVRDLSGYVNDVHAKLRLYLPEGLSKGVYTLRVRVTDRIGRKQAVASLELPVK